MVGRGRHTDIVWGVCVRCRAMCVGGGGGGGVWCRGWGGGRHCVVDETHATGEVAWNMLKM